MKKSTLIFLTIISLLYSCDSDDDPNNSGDLIRVDRIYNNTGNSAILNFETSEKFKTYYASDALKNNVEYDSDNKMTKFTKYADDGIADREYTFSYDTDGNITSVHDFYSHPFFTYEPTHQDRTVTWNGNTMTIPLLVDDVDNIYDNYEFTFNNDDLLSRYKVTKADGTVLINIDFAYDNNRNPIHLTGFYEGFSHVNVNVESTYDNKINPFFPHYDKYYVNNLIIYGARPGSGFSVSDLLSVYYHFGKNNPLLVDRNNTQALYFSYDYNGNKPASSYYKNSTTIYTTSNFVYR